MDYHSVGDMGGDMISAAIRPQRSVIGTSGQLCRAFEFDYLRARFYIQETDAGYAVVEETGGALMPVRGQRRQLILSEFERAKRQGRV
jgi:hypothetical protein